MYVDCYILFNKKIRVLGIISLLEADMKQNRRQFSKLIRINSYILFNKNTKGLDLFSLLEADMIQNRDSAVN